MKFKLSKLAIGLVAVCAFSGQAVANPITISEAQLLAGVTETHHTSFTDIFTFTVPSESTVWVDSIFAVTNDPLPTIGTLAHPVGSQVNDINLALTVFNSANVQQHVATVGSWAGDYVLTSGETYTLDVTGTPTGAQGGTYTLSGNVSAVPEPTEGALLLSGLGLMGFIASRRSRKEA